MEQKQSKGLWLIAAGAILIGLYPIAYTIIPSNAGLLATKSNEVLANPIWSIFFYTHISSGALALLVGWINFMDRIRIRKPHVHRALGKLYVISVIIGGISGAYISFYATGGLFSGMAFFSLALFWLFSTIKALRSIQKGDVITHEWWMKYSYASTFAAVTLRIWLPILIVVFGDFIPAYQFTAWLCWVPNVLFIAYFHRKSLRTLNV